MTKKISFGAALLMLLLMPHSGRALMIHYSLKDLVARSDLVLQVKTENVSYGWDEGHTFIFTSVTLSLTDQIVGQTGERTITVRYPGGQIGDTTMEVEDTPTFKTGEAVIVFLDKQDSHGVRKVFGNFQGKFTIDNGVVLENRTPLTTFIEHIKTTAQELERR